MEAFEQIYRQHSRRVFSLALRMTRSTAEAEDLTQDIFIQLYKKIGGFRGESAFATWLHRFTVNHVLMHFRKINARRERMTEEGEMPAQAAPGTENPNQMSIVDRVALDQAIAELPPGYRMTFVLHDIQGYEHTEIARLMNCSVGTTKSQLHKARMKLRRLLRQKARPCIVP
jgi:RNA polymerase sigma-70 factor, ECF subfamily